MITPKYFRVLKTPVLRGRNFTDADTAESPKVVIINEAMAKKWFPNTDPIRKRITFSDPRKPDVEWVTIVGVVATMRHRGLIGAAIGLAIALVSSRALQAMLYNVGAFDISTFVLVTLALGSVALLASYIPAVRATRADPMIALGHNG